MTSAYLEPLLLYKIDPVRNMARFYVLTIEPTLFGGTSLVRSWGRIGTRGQHKIQIFPDIVSSTANFEKIARQKQRRGYVPAPHCG